MSSELMTGWFGIPGGRESDSTKVHICESRTTGNRARLLPVCGTCVSSRQEFQFCAHGVEQDYVECRRCRQSKEFKAEVKRHVEAYAKWKMQWAERLRRKPSRSKSSHRARAQR